MTEDPKVNNDLTDRFAESLPPAWSSRQTWIVRVLFAIVVVLGLLATLTTVLALRASRDASGAKQSERHNAQVAQAQAQAVQALASQVQGLGHSPVVAPSALPSVSTPVAQGMPSDLQVQNAVTLYLASHPVPSPSIDYSVLRAFLYTYLAEHPAPPGKTGATGAAGPSGASGAGPTDFQVSAGIAAFCASHNQCSGPVGSTGPTGPAGSPGPSGPTGPAGPSGAPGEPPTSWTYTLAGTTYECDRVTPFDPANPKYTCSPQVPTNTSSPTP